ncbi:MAG: hypothetical protein QW589_01435 [Candidatus Bathyarchaeia archaeon]
MLYDSHGPIDLLASNVFEILAVQVKKSGHLSEKDLGKLIEWVKAFNAKPIIAEKRRGRWKLKPI